MKNKSPWIIGLFFLQLVLILIFFRFNWKLIVFSSVFFLISSFINVKWISILVCSISLIIISIPIIHYRIPDFNSRHIIESKIEYHRLDFGQGDFGRSLFESIINNNRTFLMDSNLHWLYMNNESRKLLNPEGFYEMQLKSYTIKARFIYYDLLLGGQSIAIVDSIWTINEPPVITK